MEKIVTLEEMKKRKANPLAMKSELTAAELEDMAKNYHFLKQVFIQPTDDAFTVMFNENLDLKETVFNLEKEVFNLKETIISLQKALNESISNRC